MENRSGQVLAVAILFFILSWLAVALRVYVRAGMLKAFGLDDWLMLLTQVRGHWWPLILHGKKERRREEKRRRKKRKKMLIGFMSSSSYSPLTLSANSEESSTAPVVISGI